MSNDALIPMIYELGALNVSIVHLKSEKIGFIFELNTCECKLTTSDPNNNFFNSNYNIKASVTYKYNNDKVLYMYNKAVDIKLLLKDIKTISHNLSEQKNAANS